MALVLLLLLTLLVMTLQFLVIGMQMQFLLPLPPALPLLPPRRLPRHLPRRLSRRLGPASCVVAKTVVATSVRLLNKSVTRITRITVLLVFVSLTRTVVTTGVV